MMKKSPDERYATPMQVAQALEPYADDYAGAADRAGEPPISEMYPPDPAAPLLTPDDDGDASEDVRLILDPDPAPSSGDGRSRPKLLSSWDDRAWVELAARAAGWLTPARLWGFVVLAVVTMALILVLATVNSRVPAPASPETGRASFPARD